MIDSGFDMKATWSVVEVLFRLMRGVAAHHRSHPFVAELAEEARTLIEAAAPPLVLQFVVEGVFRSRHMVSTDVEGYRRAMAVRDSLAHLGVNELSFEGTPTSDDIITLGECLARAVAAPSDVLDTLRLETVRWRELPTATRDSEVESVDRDVAAASHLSIALDDAERAVAHPTSWWQAAGSVVRRLEGAIGHDGEAVARALEIATAATPARRAVSATFWALRCLERVGAARATRRATAHSLCLIAFAGLRPRGGRLLGDAAADALAQVIGAATSTSGIEPHRVRVCALLHGCLRSDDARPAGAVHIEPLLTLCYQLECERCPTTTTFDLTQTDIIALAANAMGRRFHEQWVRVLISATGALPPGAQVRLADGRQGVVVGAGPQLFCPLVLVDGIVVTPTAAVSFRAEM